MRAIFFLCCEGVSLDRVSNGVTIYSVLEDIIAAGFPFFWQKMFLIASFQKEEGDQDQEEIRTRISIEEDEIFDKTTTLQFHSKSKARLIVQLQSTVIPKPGRLKVSLFNKGTEVTSYSIQVKAAQEPKMEVLNPNAENPPEENQPNQSPNQNT